MLYLLSILIGITAGYDVPAEYDNPAPVDNPPVDNPPVDNPDFVVNNDPTNGCCDLHKAEATCNAEVGTSCIWMPVGDVRIPYTDDGSQQCVSAQLADCLDACVATGLAPDFIVRSNVCPPAPTGNTPTCEFEVCTNHEPEYNIQFILDESGSVGMQSYIDSVDFVMNMIKNDVNKPAKISAYSFSNNPEERYSFTDDQTSRAAVLSALESSKSAYQGKCTDTLAALERGISDFEDDPIVSPTDNNYLFLITDGVPYCGCGLDTSCRVDVCGDSGAAMRARLTHYNIRVFTMAIGNFDVLQISCLSDTNDIFEVASFSSNDFTRLEEAVRTTLCEVKTTSIPEQILAVFANGVQSFNESTVLVKAMIVLFVAAMIYGIYYRKKKYAGYEQLEFDAEYV